MKIYFPMLFSFIILVSNCSQNQKISSLSTPYDSKNYQSIKKENYQKMIFTPYNFQEIINQEISLKPILVKNISNKERILLKINNSYLSIKSNYELELNKS